MANLPAVRQPELPAKLTKIQQLAVEYFCEGKTITAASNELARRNGHSARTWRRIIRKWATEDDLFQKAVAAAAHAELVTSTPRVVKAVVNRAGRGNPNMARLALEASGFHNPKVDHKHSGEVKITVSGLPRPTAGPDETPPTEPIIDAEVVE